jgi:hypothetical protein
LHFARQKYEKPQVLRKSQFFPEKSLLQELLLGSCEEATRDIARHGGKGRLTNKHFAHPKVANLCLQISSYRYDDSHA